MQIKTFDGKFIELPLPPTVNSDTLLALPALTDCHVHFRVPGAEQKEDWLSGARAAIAGGVTRVLDMPNNTPPTTTNETLNNKRKQIESQLSQVGIALNFGLYLGATPNNTTEIAATKEKIIGIKVFMGASTGSLLLDQINDQEKVWKLASELNLVVAVHPEDELILKASSTQFPTPTISDHSLIRERRAAVKATTTAIALSKKYRTKTYLLHVSTAEEVELIRQAKAAGAPIFAEVTPHHLFLTSDSYSTLGTLAQMNPPLRTSTDCEALLAGLVDGTIDTVATDHAPHTLAEKSAVYPASPSGVPGIETLLPLLLNAYHQNKISLERIVEVTSINPTKIFSLPKLNDWVVVDLAEQKTVTNSDLKTKCGWSPFADLTLTGWPKYTVLNDIVYDCKTSNPVRQTSLFGC